MLLFGERLLGATSAVFAFLVVWVPMTWLGTVSRVFQPRLPRRYHELRDFERDPWLYQLLGVRLVKRLLRRGPLALFNPGLHLPAERSPERLAELEQRMKDAEASHFVLLVAMLGVVINAAGTRLVGRSWPDVAVRRADERLPGHAPALQPGPAAWAIPDHAGRRAFTTQHHLTVGPRAITTIRPSSQTNSSRRVPYRRLRPGRHSSARISQVVPAELPQPRSRKSAKVPDDVVSAPLTNH